ncbi:unnamed protein product [Mytilus edulis]|uniref:DZIP3-like HEPN domain-containing protein n=1 Tax=Mytilus edulis TaxID=6550 RepID=A0A8S3PZH0_MYTED|nr:unnamed protein product [Mytilus edulis]
MSLSEEESNFLRFYFLNLKIATKAVRVYFDYVHPPAGLAGELTKSSVTLKGLRFMTKLQLQILYPSPRKLRFVYVWCLPSTKPATSESAPVTGWDKLPLPGDTSTSADLVRVKWYRNQIVHSKDGILSPIDFSQFWGDLEVAIGRLGGTSLLSEAQSAHQIVLDRSLTDMLFILRNCEKNVNDLHLTQVKHGSMIDDLQKAIENQSFIKEQYENKRLNDSHQKVKVDNLTNQLTRQEWKYENKFKEIDEKLVKHDGQIAKQDELRIKQGGQLAKHKEQLSNCEKNIDDISEKLHDTNVTSGKSSLVFS